MALHKAAYGACYVSKHKQPTNGINHKFDTNLQLLMQ